MQRWLSASSYLFFGSPWFAHHIRIFDEGTYTFDTTCNKTDFDTGVTTCNREFSKDADGNVIQTEQFLTVTVGSGQVGALIFFDWNTTEDIDVFLVWDRNAPWDNTWRRQHQKTSYMLVRQVLHLIRIQTGNWYQRDVDGDGIVGICND